MFYFFLFWCAFCPLSPTLLLLLSLDSGLVVVVCLHRFDNSIGFEAAQATCTRQARSYYTIYNYSNCHDVETDSIPFRNRIRCASIQLTQSIVVLKKGIKLGRLFVLPTLLLTKFMPNYYYYLFSQRLSVFLFGIHSFFHSNEFCLLFSTIFF